MQKCIDSRINSIRRGICAQWRVFRRLKGFSFFKTIDLLFNKLSRDVKLNRRTQVLVLGRSTLVLCGPDGLWPQFLHLCVLSRGSGCCCSVSKSCLTPVTLWTAACQGSLSFTVSWSLLKFISIELVILSNHLVLYHPLLLLPSIFPSSRVFSNELTLHIRDQSIRASTWLLLNNNNLPMIIQGWFPLGLTDLISLQSKELSKVFSSPTTQKHQSFGTQPCLGPNPSIRMWLLEKP